MYVVDAIVDVIVAVVVDEVVGVVLAYVVVVVADGVGSYKIVFTIKKIYFYVQKILPIFFIKLIISLFFFIQWKPTKIIFNQSA